MDTKDKIAEQDADRVVNLRVFLYVAVSLVYIILSCYMLFLHPILGVLLLFLGLVVPVVMIFYHHGQGDTKRFVTYILVVICVVVVGSVFFGKIIFWQTNQIGGDFRVGGRVVSVWVSDDDGYVSLELDKLTLDSKGVGGHMRVGVSVKDPNSVLHMARTGDYFAFEGFVSSYDVLGDDGFNLSRLRSGVRFFSRILDTDSVATLLPKATAGMASFRLRLSDILDKYLSMTNSGVAKAMLLGDRSSLDADGNNIFALSGLAHVLSVSGMHISILAVTIMFVLKKCRLNKTIAFFVTLIFAFLYAWLAGFGTPMLRALIMFVVYGICDLRGKWYDSLNSLCFAAIILLLFDPFYLFDVSFILSFGTVLSIALFNKTILKKLSFVRLGKLQLNRVRQTLSVAISVQPMSIILTSLTINRFAPYSIISNILLMPIFNVIFVGFMILVPLTFAIPLFGFGLSLLNYAMDFFMYLMEFAANIPFSNVFVWVSVVPVLAILVCFFLCSRFMLKNKVRIISLCVSLFLYAIVFATGTPTPIKYAIVPMANNQTIINTGDQNLYFGRIGAKASESFAILDFRISRIHSLFLADDSFVNAGAIRSISRSFGIRQIFVPLTTSVGDIVAMRDLGLDVTILDGQQLVDSGEFGVGAIIEDNIFMGYRLIGGSTNILVTAQNTPLSKFDTQFLWQFDILRASSSIGYNDAVQIVDYSFFDINPDQVFVASDFPNHYFDYREYEVNQVDIEN